MSSPLLEPLQPRPWPKIGHEPGLPAAIREHLWQVRRAWWTFERRSIGEIDRSQRRRCTGGACHALTLASLRIDCSWFLPGFFPRSFFALMWGRF